MAARVEAIATRPVVKRQAWKNLTAHYKKVRELHLRKLFAEDPKRGCWPFSGLLEESHYDGNSQTVD